MLQRLALRLIAWYQKRGGGNRLFAVDCNFEPSCSEYTKQAIERFGAIKGIRLGFARIRRCNQPDLPRKIDDPVPVCESPGCKEHGDMKHV